MAAPGRIETKTFVDRLLAAAVRGQELGDPRSPGAMTAWADICDGIPDAMLTELVPGTVRLLFRKPEIAKRLTASGLREGISLQHEAIAPYIVAFRRMREIRRAGGVNDPTQLLAESRRELRALNDRFHAALDQAMRLQAENVRLRTDLDASRKGEQAAKAEAETLRAEALRYRQEAEHSRAEALRLGQEAEAERTAAQRTKAEMEEHRRAANVVRNEIEDVAARALSKLALALQSLKESMERRVNDPESTLLESASLSVQSYYMVLEDLGRGGEAMKLAKRILGDKLKASGFG